MRWIGPPDAEEPAPQVTLAAAKRRGAAAAEPVAAEPASGEDDEEEGDDGAPVWLAVLALALGALGAGRDRRAARQPPEDHVS